MLTNLTYQEYISIRTKNIRNHIEEMLMHLESEEDYEEFLNSVLERYSMIVYQNVLTMYRSVNLNPELYEIEESISKITDHHVKQKVAEAFFEIELLQSAINDITDIDAYEREHHTLKEILDDIPPEERNNVIELLKRYEQMYHEEAKYIGSGETCTAFQIGNKVIKFGAMRSYENIPYCLSIERYIPYGRNKYMYITDKVETGNISEQDTQNMYNALRSQGFVWLDARPDNIGRLHNSLKILDDIDIYSEKDLLSIKGGTVLEYVSYSNEISLRELNWLNSITPNFDINSINQFYRNQSTKTQDQIEHIKEEYKKQHNTYSYDPNTSECLEFYVELRKAIEEANQKNSSTTPNKVL